MPYEQKDFSGSVFPNDRKQSQNQPDHKGKCMIEGVLYYVSAWEKQGSKGPWLSLAFTPVGQEQPAGNGGGSSYQQSPDRPTLRPGGFGAAASPGGRHLPNVNDDDARLL